MDTERLEQVQRYARWVGPRLAETAFGLLRRLPSVRQRLRQELDGMAGELERQIKPYRDDFPSYPRLPERGRPRQAILREVEAYNVLEQSRWRDGYVSGAVYHGDREHIEFLDEVYALCSQSNPLHSDLWPSTSKYEAEIVSMTAHMLGAAGGEGQGDPETEVCGCVSSGGTESILLAMKAYRERAREVRGIRRPEMVVPTTAHAAFHKASTYFGIKLVTVPVGSDCRADVVATRRAINRRTAVVVGSAPAFPHGVVDPIEELSELARSKGIGFHTDACLGGFVLPWAERLGYPVPAYDFRLPGVTSMSVDTHKYGYAAKGTSVVLYRGHELRHHQYYRATEWPGGLYFSPTLAGSRPGGLTAACRASLMSVGEQGYLDATRRILEAATEIKDGIASISELHVLGDPLWVIAFASSGPDIYRVMDLMSQRGWNLNGLHRPASLHICVTLRHTQPGVAGRFVADLETAVEQAKRGSSDEGGRAPLYGLAASFPLRGVVADLLNRYMDILYKV